jgi:hypothetical protein
MAFTRKECKMQSETTLTGKGKTGRRKLKKYRKH